MAALSHRDESVLVFYKQLKNKNPPVRVPGDYPLIKTACCMIAY